MKKEQKLVMVSVVIMTLLGLSGVMLRTVFLRKNLLPSGESIWRLTYDIEFDSEKIEKSSIVLPDNLMDKRICRESFTHEGLWMDIISSKYSSGRQAVIVSGSGDTRRRFFSEFDIHFKNEKPESNLQSASKMPVELRAHYMKSEKGIDIGDTVVRQVISDLKGMSLPKEEFIEAVFTYCSDNIITSDEYESDSTNVLANGKGTVLGRSRAMVALCRAAKIPARTVSGFVLENNRDLRLHYWVEIYHDKKWKPYDPENGFADNLPVNYVKVSNSGNNIVNAGNSSFSAKYSAYKIVPGPGHITISRENIYSIFDFTRLSPSMQQILMLILLIPTGALITAIFRNIVGVHTYGTFTPTLLAISFVQADWKTGLYIFIIIMLLGIMIRLFLNRMKLLMVSRLSIILTLIVLCMITVVSILDYLDLTPTASAVLLPMVIMTMIIERFNICAEEGGFCQACKLFISTMFVGLCCLLILRWNLLSRLVLTFPEVHFFTVALLLMIGRYSGYRLSELWRFKEMANAQ